MPTSAILDVLTLVSSDKRFPLDVTRLMATGEVRLVHTFRTGSECLRALSLDDQATRKLVLIDSLIPDISPANLCDAIRLSHPNISIIMVVEQDDIDGVQRAMLAGAKSTISRQANPLELARTIERVLEVSSRVQQGTSTFQSRHAGNALQNGHAFGDLEQRGVLVPFIGARGGAGRSTLSISLAALAAEAQIDTALLDCDLQFGDLHFIFGTTQSENGDDLLRFVKEVGQAGAEYQKRDSVRRFGKQVSSKLHLYTPQAVPEKTEALAQHLPAAIERLRSEHELVIVNTGAFWTLFHAELIEHSDLAVCILDQSIVGVRATVELREICKRLGIPASRLIYIMNRVKDASLRPEEVAEVLQADKVFPVDDAGIGLRTLFDSGDLQGLVNQAPFMTQLYAVLDELSIRSDISVHDALSLRFAMRRRKGLLRRA